MVLSSKPIQVRGGGSSAFFTSVKVSPNNDNFRQIF
jgi:hypothetical protein